MICMLHGYLLEGSGSNLWTRSVIQSLCRGGHTVHLMCQENHPEIYDFIGEVLLYGEDGGIETLFSRETPYPGQCVMHKPYIGKTLPVYVWDQYEEFSDVRPMIELSDAEIEFYLENNIRTLKQIVEKYKIKAIHANHAVLMSVVARRVSDEFSVPYAIMPHGSAIEYAVKKDKRIFNMAREAFADAGLVFVIGREIRQRVNAIFPDIEGLNGKMVDLNLGVDTSLFEPVSRNQKAESISALAECLKDVARGKRPEMSDGLREASIPDTAKQELLDSIARNSDYNPKHTDHGAEDRLKSLDWENDRVMLFVGRLIASKGIHLIVAALPFIFQKNDRAKLMIVGHGPLREPLEALLHAFETGSRSLAENIVEWGTELEGTGKQPFREIKHYFERLESQGKLDEYFAAAQKHISRDRVVFTGYLTHRELRYLFPVCDAAIFPSVVAEAGPLVFLEAMASGCFPMGTYFAGMAASIDSVAGLVPDNVLDLMKLSADEKETINDIAEKAGGALDVEEDIRKALRRVAVEKYDWRNIGKRLAENLLNM